MLEPSGTGTWQPILCISSQLTFSDLILAAWDWAWWEYLHHRNRWALQIRAFFSSPLEGRLLNNLKAYSWVELLNSEVFFSSNNFQLWDRFLQLHFTPLPLSWHILLSFLHLYNLSNQAVWAVLVFILVVTPEILLLFIHYYLDTFIPMMCWIRLSI